MALIAVYRIALTGVHFFAVRTLLGRFWSCLFVFAQCSYIQHEVYTTPCNHQNENNFSSSHIASEVSLNRNHKNQLTNVLSKTFGSRYNTLRCKDMLPPPSAIYICNEINKCVVAWWLKHWWFPVVCDFDTLCVALWEWNFPLELSWWSGYVSGEPEGLTIMTH